MPNAQLPLDSQNDDVNDAWLQMEEMYRQLVLEHQMLDERIHQLARTPHLTATQQVEESLLKKRKLALKDRISAMARERHAQSG